MNRRDSRASAMKLIFQLPFNLELNTDETMQLFSDSGEKYDDFSKNLYEGVLSKLDEIDNAITPHLKNWNFERLSKITVAVLRLCTYEILYTEVPIQVAINEAVELVKIYDEQKTSAFVNGVLGKIAVANGKL